MKRIFFYALIVVAIFLAGCTKKLSRDEAKRQLIEDDHYPRIVQGQKKYQASEVVSRQFSGNDTRDKLQLIESIGRAEIQLKSSLHGLIEAGYIEVSMMKKQEDHEHHRISMDVVVTDKFMEYNAKINDNCIFFDKGVWEFIEVEQILGNPKKDSRLEVEYAVTYTPNILGRSFYKEKFDTHHYSETFVISDRGWVIED